MFTDKLIYLILIIGYGITFILMFFFFPMIWPVVIVVLLIYTIKVRFFPTKAKKVNTDFSKMEVTLGPLKKPLLILSVFLVIGSVLFCLYGLFQTSTLAFNNYIVEGKVNSKECTKRDRKTKKCLYGLYVYSINYSVNNKIYTVKSWPSGKSSYHPSFLFYQGAQIGDDVDVYVSKLDPSNASVGTDRYEGLIAITPILTTALAFLVVSIRALVRSYKNS